MQLSEQRICHPSVLINALYLLSLRRFATLEMHRNSAFLKILLYYGALTWLFMNSNGDDYLAIFCERLDDLVAMDSAPSWNVAFHAWIGAGNCEQVTILEGIDFVLGANDRHRTQ